MSRIGKYPVEIPQGVEVALRDGVLNVKGPKGELSLNVHREMKVKVEDGSVTVERSSEESHQRALHGLTRSLIANMVQGVTDGFERKLEIVGVGYRAEKSAKGLTLHVGFSHPVQYDAPEGIDLEVPSPTEILVKGADKQLVGQVAAELRGVRPPEPYKGKGVRYADEQVRRKAGKTATA